MIPRNEQSVWSSVCIHCFIEGACLLASSQTMLHFLPTAFRCLAEFKANLDMFPANSALHWHASEFTVLHWDTWTHIGAYLDLPSMFNLALTGVNAIRAPVCCPVCAIVPAVSLPLSPFLCSLHVCLYVCVLTVGCTSLRTCHTYVHAFVCLLVSLCI